MAEETKSSSTAVKEYLDDIVFKVMRENAEFLDNNAKEVYSEVVELQMDAIDYFGLPILKGESREKEFLSVPWLSSYIMFSGHSVVQFTRMC